MRKRIHSVLRGGTAQIILAAIIIFSAGITGVAAKTTIELQISPNKDVVSSEEIVSFKTFVVNDQGDSIDVTKDTVFSENDPFGSIVENVYFPGKIGTWTVRASYLDMIADAKITVTEGPLASIVINPNTKPEVVRLGSTRTFTAEGFDARNNRLSDISPTWAVQGDAGTITNKGVFTAKKEGDATVTAAINGVSAAVRVKVVSIPDESAATNTNANANSNTNTTRNTNATNGNSNTNSGSVLGEETNGNSNTNTSTTEKTTECSTYVWWIWILGILVYLAVLGGYYYVVRRRSDLMLWIVPIILTGLALWGYFALTCSGHFLWVPWVLVIGGLLITLFRPREFHPTNGQQL